MFANKVIVVTGGANGIGKCIAGEFEKLGAHVYVIDSTKSAKIRTDNQRSPFICKS